MDRLRRAAEIAGTTLFLLFFASPMIFGLYTVKRYDDDRVFARAYVYAQEAAEIAAAEPEGWSPAVMVFTPEEAEALLERFAEERLEAERRAEAARRAEKERRAAAQAAAGDQYLLAVIIGQETAGVNEDAMMAVGNVVLNRVADPRFPGTIYGVLTAPGQYGHGDGSGFYWNSYVSLEGRARCMAVAARLLAGERVLPANVVWQAGFPQGRGTYAYYNIAPHGMYLCY